MQGREPKRTVPKRRLRRSLAGTTRPPLPTPAGAARIFVPQAYEAAYDYPLVVWLADAARPFDLGRTMARTSLRNFLAVHPAPGGDPETRVWKAIDRVRDRWSIHPRRIYLAGQGSGGSDAFRIACRAPEAFAGVVSLGGAFPVDEGLFAAAARVRRLPMLLCLRRDVVSADPAPIDRALRLFHAAGATLSLRIYPGAVDLSRAALADVNRWLMEDVCGTAAATPARCAP